jgi:predicted RNase H-like HicB family nuclease
MLLEYIQGALEDATYRQLEDGTWFGQIPGFDGVWANGPTVESSRKELAEVLEEWLLLKIRAGDPIPVIKGIDLAVRESTAP